MSTPNCPHVVPYVVATAPGGVGITLAVEVMVTCEVMVTATFRVHTLPFNEYAIWPPVMYAPVIAFV